MTVILLATCILTPYNIALSPDESQPQIIINIVTDCLFGIDIIVVFMSEYYDADMNLVTDHKLIA